MLRVGHGPQWLLLRKARIGQHQVLKNGDEPSMRFTSADDDKYMRLSTRMARYESKLL